LPRSEDTAAHQQPKGEAQKGMFEAVNHGRWAQMRGSRSMIHVFASAARV
jgi:hypothetical protein